MYEYEWLEDFYQEKVAEWKKSGEKLSRRLFEAEYKEDIFYLATENGV